MKKPLLVLVARRRRRSFIGSLIFKFLMQKSFKNKFSWPNHPLISCIAYVILLFVEFKLCRLCPLIVLTLSFSCVSFDFLLCEIQIVLTLAFCCVHFDFFNFCRLCPSIVLTLSFYCVDFKWHMSKLAIVYLCQLGCLGMCVRSKLCWVGRIEPCLPLYL